MTKIPLYTLTYEPFDNDANMPLYRRANIFYYSPRRDYVHVFLEVSRKELELLSRGDIPRRLKDYKWTEM